MNMVRAVRLSDDLWSRVQAAATRQGTSASAVLRDLINVLPPRPVPEQREQADARR